MTVTHRFIFDDENRKAYIESANEGDVIDAWMNGKAEITDCPMCGEPKGTK